jgi:hypothetical protein
LAVRKAMEDVETDREEGEKVVGREGREGVREKKVSWSMEEVENKQKEESHKSEPHTEDKISNPDENQANLDVFIQDFSINA